MTKPLSIFLGLMIIAVSVPQNGQAAGVSPLLGYYGEDYWVLLGGSSDGKWLTSEKMALRLKGKEKYRLYSLNGPLGTAKGRKVGSWGQADPEFLIRIKPIPNVKDGVVGVGGSWNAMPRQPQLLKESPQPYIEAAAEVLKSKGVTDSRVELTQVIEIDLDNDGEKEVVVSAKHFNESEAYDSPQKGDYSMVFLQKRGKGGVSNILIGGHFVASSEADTSPFSIYRVVGLVDANGDGVMEILVSHTYYEGGGAALYQLTGDKVGVVLDADWGA